MKNGVFKDGPIKRKESLCFSGKLQGHEPHWHLTSEFQLT